MESSENPDGRQRYRAAPDWPDQLSVAAIDAQGRDLEGQIVDLSAGGIGLFFRKPRDPGLNVGDTVYLRLRSDEMAKPIVVLAQVRRASKFDWGHNYGLTFVDWMGLLSQIPAGLARLFNRRSQWRVKLEPKHLVAVSVEGPATSAKSFGPVKGILRDVSPMGLSFRVKNDAEEMMSSSPLVHVSFILPESAAELDFWARVLHRETDDHGICYGIVFDREATAHFDDKEKALLSSLRVLTSEKETELQSST